jgi:hypothetical protein
MIRRLLAAALLAVALSPVPSVAAAHRATTHAAARSILAQFDTEAAAHAHYPVDTVVSRNTNSGFYHKKGSRWYDKTTHGAYACPKKADAAGERATRTGQIA